MSGEQQENIVNTILLEGMRVDTQLTVEQFWQLYDETKADKRLVVVGILGEEVSFFPRAVLGFIDRKNFKVPEEVQNAMSAAVRKAGLAPQGGRSGIVVPGGGGRY